MTTKEFRGLIISSVGRRLGHKRWELFEKLTNSSGETEEDNLRFGQGVLGLLEKIPGSESERQRKILMRKLIKGRTWVTDEEETARQLNSGLSAIRKAVRNKPALREMLKGEFY